MVMINLSPATEELAQRVADARNLSVEDAIQQALVASAHSAGVMLEPGHTRDPSAEAVAARQARINQIVREIAAMPILDRRSAREIMDDLNTL